MTQRMDAPATAVDFNNENANTSANPTFESVLGARLSRRGLLRGGVGSVGTAVLTGFGVTAHRRWSIHGTTFPQQTVR